MSNFTPLLKVASAVVAAVLLTKIAFMVLHLAMGIIHMALVVAVWGLIFLVIYSLFFKKKGPDTPTA